MDRDKIEARYLEISRAVIEEHRQAFDRMDISHIMAFLQEIKAAKSVFVAGIGREGISMRSFAMRLAHLGKPAYWVWDDTTIAVAPGDLFIAADGSAAIPSLENMLRKAKQAGARVVLLTSAPKGPHTKFADLIVHVHAVSYLSENVDCPATIQLMGNPFEQHLYMLCDIIVMLYMEENGLKPEDLEKRHRNIE